eukprot:2775371-Pyramimonas_sp.AAC.1
MYTLHTVPSGWLNAAAPDACGGYVRSSPDSRSSSPCRSSSDTEPSRPGPKPALGRGVAGGIALRSAAQGVT